MNIQNKNHKSCIIISRVSSKDQEIEGYSLPSQEKLLTEYAQRNDLIVKHKFAVSETGSKKEQRKVFNQVLKLAVQDKIDALIFEKVDRVTRNLHSSVDIYDWLEADENRQLHCVKDSLILHKFSKSQDKLNWDIKVAMAKNYADNLSEEVRKGKAEKISQGWYPGPAPLGYKSVDALGSKRKIQILDVNKASYVKRCFELMSTGDYSLETLTVKMNKEGMTNNKNHKMVRSGMHEVLRNPYYYGAFKWTGKIYENGKHEPLISRELFEIVQNTLMRKPDAKYRKHFYMLKGLVRCGECGGTISWFEKKGHTYGRCNHHRECSQSTCGREDQCEEVVTNALQSLKVQSPRLMDWIKKALKEGNNEQEMYIQYSLEHLSQQLKTIEAKQARLYDDRLEEIITIDTYKAKNAAFETEKVKLTGEIEKVSKDSNRYYQLGSLIYEVAQNATELFTITQPDQRRELLKYIFGEITLLEGKLQYSYTKPFAILYDAVKVTNESSKLFEKAEITENIFEPAVMIEQTVKSEFISAVCTEIRRAWDYFRTWLLTPNYCSKIEILLN